MDAKVLQNYEIANEAVKAQNFESGLQAYQQALRLLCRSTEDTSFPLEDNVADEKQLLWIRCQLNVGFCHFKLRNYFDAIDANTAILDAIDLLQLLRLETAIPIEEAADHHAVMIGFQVKALIRRSTAYEYIEEYEHALQDLHTANRLQPSNALSSHPTIKKLQNLLLQDKHTSEQTPTNTGVLAVEAQSSGSSGTTRYQGKLVNVAQSLRLIFRKVPTTTSLPLHPHQINTSKKKTVLRSQPVAYKLALGNEFGLFARHLYTSAEHQDSIGTLRCELITIRNTTNTKYTIATVGSNHNEHQPSITWMLPHDGKTSIHLRIIAETEPNGEIRTSELDLIMLEFSIEGFAKPNVQIVPIISLPLQMVLLPQADEDNKPTTCTDAVFTDLKGKEDKIQATCIRPIEVTTLESLRKVYVYESPGLLGIGGKVWDSSFILVDYVGKHFKELIDGKTVLELGCGTGVTGLSLSYFAPKHVILTDMKEVVPLLDLNITLHQLLLKSSNRCIETQLTGMDLMWGSPLYDDNGELNALGAQMSQVETIIASDVVYYPEGYQPLINTIDALFKLPSESKKMMILAHRHRHPQDQDFFVGMYALPGIVMEEIHWMDDYFKTANDSENTEGSLHDVRLFRINGKI